VICGESADETPPSIDSVYLADSTKGHGGELNNKDAKGAEGRMGGELDSPFFCFRRGGAFQFQ